MKWRIIYKDGTDEEVDALDIIDAMFKGKQPYQNMIAVGATSN